MMAMAGIVPTMAGIVPADTVDRRLYQMVGATVASGFPSPQSVSVTQWVGQWRLTVYVRTVDDLVRWARALDLRWSPVRVYPASGSGWQWSVDARSADDTEVAIEAMFIDARHEPGPVYVPAWLLDAAGVESERIEVAA